MPKGLDLTQRQHEQTAICDELRLECVALTSACDTLSSPATKPFKHTKWHSVGLGRFRHKNILRRLRKRVVTFSCPGWRLCVCELALINISTTSLHLKQSLKLTDFIWIRHRGTWQNVILTCLILTVNITIIIMITYYFIHLLVLLILFCSVLVNFMIVFPLNS